MADTVADQPVPPAPAVPVADPPPFLSGSVRKPVPECAGPGGAVRGGPAVRVRRARDQLLGTALPGTGARPGAAAGTARGGVLMGLEPASTGVVNGYVQMHSSATGVR